MTAEVRLAGEVVSGAAKAAFFTRLDWVRQQCRQQLGFDPYPGTLNVRVSEKHLAALKGLFRQPGVELAPPTKEFCSARALPVRIGGIAGALILPQQDVRIHDDTVVEIMAPVLIRDALGLSDGSTVEIVWQSGHSDRGKEL
jgi:CTP-dependent riboflavin kinase